jgi:hypothetical protein
MLSLAGCATALSDPAATPCPPLASYTAAELAEASGEFVTVKPGGMIERMIRDYSLLRDQVRRCRPGA